MSSRRSRLKAVANLPVRKRTDVKEHGTEYEAHTEENTCVIVKSDSCCDPNDTSLVSTNGETDKIQQTESLENIKPKGPEKYNRLLRPQIPLPVRRQKQNSISESVNVEKDRNEVCEVSQNACLGKSDELESSKNSKFETNTQDVVNKVKPEVVSQPVGSNNVIQGKIPIRSRFVKPSLRALDSPRRMSIHASSASESEDDVRRNVNTTRVHRISESSQLDRCSINNNPNEITNNETQSNDNQLVISRRRRQRSVNITVRRIAEARRIFQLKFFKEKPVRSDLTMFDLIFYNPGNPESKIKKENIKVEEDEEEKIDEELVDDPDIVKKSDVEDKDDDEDECGENYDAMPVPQVKIGPNGEIILDEKSLVVETIDSKKGRESLKNSIPIYEEKRSSYYYKRKNSRSKTWSSSETIRFYKALKLIGTDFSLMQTLFPTRTRMELKRKFKKEEKCNRSLINKALSHPGSFNMEELRKDLEMEREREEKEKQETEEVLEKKMTEKKLNVCGQKKSRKRTSLLFRELGMEIQETKDTVKDLPVIEKNNEMKVLKVVQQQQEQQQRLVEQEEEIEPVVKKEKKAPIVIKPKGKIVKKNKMQISGEKKEFEDEDLENLKQVKNEDFYKLLAHNMLNLNETTIKLQVIDNDKDVNVIFEDVPVVTMEELGSLPHSVIAACPSTNYYEQTDVGIVSGGLEPVKHDSDNNDTVMFDDVSDEIRTEDVMYMSHAGIVSEVGANTCDNSNFVMFDDVSDEIRTKDVTCSTGVVDCTRTKDVTLKNQVLSEHSYVSLTNKILNAVNSGLPECKPGSFLVVSRSNEGGDSNCPDDVQMFMMTENLDDNGTISYNALPAVLPPELLETISNRMDS